MFRWLQILFLSVFSFCIQTPVQATEIVPGAIQFSAAETPDLISRGLRSPIFCGGVKISEKQYLTAAHCTDAVVSGASPLKTGARIKIDGIENVVVAVHFPQGTLEMAKKIVKCQSGRCRIPLSNQWIDLAVIEFESENAIPIANVEVSSETLQPGQPVIVSGNEISLGVLHLASSTPAEITVQDAVTGTVKLNGLDGHVVNWGDSGSPVWVLNDSGQPELIGISSQAVSELEMRYIKLKPKLLNELGFH